MSSTSATMQRTNVLQCSEYFMGIAKLAKMRSAIFKARVGACIVDREDRIVAIGCNTALHGISTPLDAKTPVIHAEIDAILNKNGANLRKSRIFVTQLPCNECAKLIIQSGISEVIYECYSAENTVVSKRMFEAAGVICTQFTTNMDRIELSLSG